MPAPIRQTPDGCKPALVSKFFSRRVERLDDSVGKENQRVARPQLQGGSFVSRIHFDSERKPSDFELLKRAVRPAQNRRIVPGVHVREAPRGRLIFAQNRGGKPPPIQAIGGGIAVQPRHQLRDRRTFAGNGAKDRKSTRLNSSHEWISYAVFCLKKKTDWHIK